MLQQHLQAAIQHVSTVAKQVTASRINFKATLDGWINVNGPGDYNLPHYHPRQHLVGCLLHPHRIGRAEQPD